MVIRIQLLDPDTEQPFYDEYVHASDGEIAAALKEDGAGSNISVDLYKRAVKLLRFRQAKEAAKEAAAEAAKEAAGGEKKKSKRAPRR